MSDERDEIRRRIDLVDLVGQKVQLKKAGKDWKGLCPFHDDRNPSFTVSPTIGRYKCWSCGAAGDCFTWVMETQKVDFGEALRLLAAEAGVDLKRTGGPKPSTQVFSDAMEAAQAFFREEYARTPSVQEYVSKRGMDDETVRKWELGYGPDMGEALAVRLRKGGFQLNQCRDLFLVEMDQQGGYYDRFRGRLTFPIRDERGRLVAFGGRIVVPVENVAKYINSSDTPLYSKSTVLYGMHVARETMAKTGRAVLVEGYMDVIACHRAGITEAVATLGTSITDDHVRLLRRWSQEAVVLYDGDEAGLKAADKACTMLAEAGLQVRVAVVAAGHDPDTLLTEGGPEAVRRVVEEAVRPIDFRLMLLDRESSPSDPSYWEKATTILSAATDELELERYLHGLAAKYPGIRDKAAARRALQKMVRAKREPHRTGKVAPKMKGQVTIPEMPMTGPERLIVRALFEPGLAKIALKAVRETETMSSPMGILFAEEVVASGWESGDPKGLMAELSPEVAMVVSDLIMRSLEPVTEQNLTEAIQRLTVDKNRRVIETMAEAATDDDQLRRLSEALTKTHVEKSSPFSIGERDNL